MGTNTRFDACESEEDILDEYEFLVKKLLCVTVNAAVFWRIEQMAVILKICILQVREQSEDNRGTHYECDPKSERQWSPRYPCVVEVKSRR